MTWIYLAAVLGVAGLAAVGVAGVRFVAAARTLIGEIAEVKAQLERRRARLAAQGDESLAQAAYDRA